MATLGLKGIWGLEQLDRTGLPTWKLVLILLSAAGVLGEFLRWRLSEMEPNPVLLNPPEADGKTAVGFIIFAAVLLSFVLALARVIERDLKYLTQLDRGVRASLDKLAVRPTISVTCMMIGLPYGYLVCLASAYPLMREFDLTALELTTTFAAGWGTSILGYVLFPLLGLISGMLVAVVIGQITCLAHAARNIRIDFLQLGDYAAIANPGVRLFLGLTALMSLEILAYLFIDESKLLAIEWISILMLLSVAVFILLLLPYGYPVWILRNRIREKKLLEMARITRALRGGKEAIASLRILGLDSPWTAPELLTYQMFLESRWEWPIASHVQKLILFGLLPPLTWVLAAIIENSLF